MANMFAHFVCALLDFCARKFLTKSKKISEMFLLTAPCIPIVLDYTDENSRFSYSDRLSDIQYILNFLYIRFNPILSDYIV